MADEMNVEQVAAPAAQTSVLGEKLKGLDPKKVTIAAVAAVLVIILIIILTSLTGPKAVAKKYAKAYMSGDLKKAEKLCLIDSTQHYIDEYYDGDEDEYLEELSDWYDEDFDSMDDYYEYYEEDWKEDLEDEFGDYKVTYEVTKVKEISKNKLEDELYCDIEDLEDEYDIDLDGAKFKVATVKIKIKGDDDTEKFSLKVYMAKDGLSWKVLYADD